MAEKSEVSAAAVPAAWPETAQGGMTRVTFHISSSADMQRPAASRFLILPQRSAEKGISYAGPRRHQSPVMPTLSGSARWSSAQRIVYSPASRRYMRTSGIVDIVTGTSSGLSPRCARMSPSIRPCPASTARESS